MAMRLPTYFDRFNFPGDTAVWGRSFRAELLPVFLLIRREAAGKLIPVKHIKKIDFSREGAVGTKNEYREAGLLF